MADSLWGDGFAMTSAAQIALALAAIAGAAVPQSTSAIADEPSARPVLRAAPPCDSILTFACPSPAAPFALRVSRA